MIAPRLRGIGWRLLRLVPALTLLAGSATGEDTTYYIHAGTLLAVPGEPPRENVTVVVKGARIHRIHDGFMAPGGGATVVYLQDHFVLPGLMDAHVHLIAQPSAFARRAGQRGRPITRAQLAMNAAVFAQRTLAAGFTTVRDVGSNDESVFAVRNAIEAGALPGPRILAAGPVISATGGHGDRGFGETESLDPNERLREGVCDGPAECTRTVRHFKKLGADLIKFTATGGFMSNTGTQQQYSREEMQAIVAVAHQRDLKVAAHAYAGDAIVAAVQSGVDSIEHGWALDDEGLRMMKERGTYLVPTLLISRPSAWAQAAGIHDASQMRDGARAFEKAYAAGVNIAFGSDAGIFDHGQNALEFEVMVELGMSPADAIRSATINTAGLFGRDTDVGSIEPGKLADVIAVKASPLDDITALRAVDFVMKGGEIVKRDGRFVGTVTIRPVGDPVQMRP